MDILSLLLRIAVTALVYFLPDLFLHSAIGKAFGKAVRKWYWRINIALFVFIGLTMFVARDSSLTFQRIQLLFLGLFIAILFAKVMVSLFLAVEWLVRAITSLATLSARRKKEKDSSLLISRRQFLAKGIILTGLLPFSGILYGMVRGRFRYTLHKEEVYIDNLPAAFDGFTITQLSDLHIGSFSADARQQLEDMVEVVNKLGSDALFFTGDIVNSRADEMDGWYEVFSRWKAKYKFSVLGNHDYGDYVNWPNETAREKNLDEVKAIHGKLGFGLLLNERTAIEKNGEQLHIVGIENWGKGDFPKLGDLEKAAQGLGKDDCMVLLSHDPSFWEEFVIPSAKRPELTLSGHTHGFQMGIETPAFRFSPSQWIYPQWAGLYSKGSQHIYVNRGLGTVGYPGRLGIWPEITQLTLKRKA